MASGTYINKFLENNKNADAGDGKSYIFMQSKWGEDSMECVIQETRTHKCYKGSLYYKEMTTIATDLEMPYKDFYEECHRALTTNIGLPGFNYQIDRDNLVFRLCKEGYFVQIYLEVNLKEVNKNYDILNTAIELIEAQQLPAQRKIVPTHDEDENFDDTLKAFQACVEEKNKLKDQLLSKFIVILNSKKKKVAELQRRLSKVEVGVSTSDFDDTVENEHDVKTVTARCPTERRRSMRRISNMSDIEEGDDEDFFAETQMLTVCPTKMARVPAQSDDSN